MYFNIVGIDRASVQRGDEFTVRVEKISMRTNPSGAVVTLVKVEDKKESDIEAELRKVVEKSSTGGLDFARAFIAGQLIVADAIKAQTEVLRRIEDNIDHVDDALRNTIGGNPRLWYKRILTPITSGRVSQ